MTLDHLAVSTDWIRVLTLQDYNTRIVVIGTICLGIAAGLIGSFTLLRKRALLGDALAHATLPGIAIAFVLATILGWNAKSLPLLLLGAAASGLIGIAAIAYLKGAVRVREDAALGIVLSVFFGAGVAVLSFIQQLPNGRSAGLESFIYGKTASLIAADAWLMLLTALLCILVCSLLFKEWKLLCFDEGYAGSRGYPTIPLDIALMTTVVLVTIVGLQAVGQVLIIALLIIPAVSARFWTERLEIMVVLSAGLGAVSCFVGVLLSALFPDLPSGPMIVLAAATLFAIGFVFGTTNGWLMRHFQRVHLLRRMEREHLLRAMYEEAEREGADIASMHFSRQVLENRITTSPARLRKSLNRAVAEGLLQSLSSDNFVFSTEGRLEASRLVREHRLWELYLITHADVAPARVDHEADRIEHVLEPELIAELQSQLEKDGVAVRGIPPNPHDPTPSTVGASQEAAKI
jgi:manganese/zinc/iron transport system permease protein